MPFGRLVEDLAGIDAPDLIHGNALLGCPLLVDALALSIDFGRHSIRFGAGLADHRQAVVALAQSTRQAQGFERLRPHRMGHGREEKSTGQRNGGERS